MKKLIDPNRFKKQKLPTPDIDDAEDLGAGFELNYCEECIQMTNHIGNVCQKCKKRKESEERKTAEIDSIKKWLNDNGIGSGTNLTVSGTAYSIQSFIAQWVTPSQSLPKITDDEIKKACPQELINRISCWIQGAKWYRNELKQRMK